MNIDKKHFGIKNDYISKLDVINTEIGIKIIKDTFERELAKNLNLLRISAPIIVPYNDGTNDNLSGNERPVNFDVPAIGERFEIVQSLAKWKRLALKRYNFLPGAGIYTDMNAIRRDEDSLDNIHSIYVDQWDWEQVISEDSRNEKKLQQSVIQILSAMKKTNDKLKEKFPVLDFDLEEKVYFISSQELEDLYPDLDDKGREKEITKKYKTVFIKGIGHKLNSGKPHDFRAPDYDDWNLNGDILIWSDLLNQAVEISSMGIRVNPETLETQLELSNSLDKKEFKYHKMLLNGELHQTIGGGIGQSRLCMLFLEKIHIGEVQASVWPKEFLKTCKTKNINIL